MNSPLAGKKVLLTQAHLVRFMGSEIVTIELAEFFSAHGAEVLVVTHATGHPASDELLALDGVTMLQLDDPALDDDLADRLPDIAWIHHSILPKRVLEHADEITFYFHHMSSILAAEFSLNAAVEVELATAVLFESPKSKDLHVATGVYELLDPARLQVMGNPAAQGFAADRGPRGSGRIIVVSNHMPAEVVDALPRLRERFDVVLVGAQTELGAAPQRVTPELIASADAVVSIGKTVQYSMVSGTPVYVYDHFGGPGWLNMDNLEQAAYENFSGRGFARKSAAEIADEIEVGLEKAWADAAVLRDPALARYSLRGRMEALFAFADEHGRTTTPCTAAAATAHDLMQQAFGVYVREWARTQRDIELLRGDVAGLRDHLGNVERDYVAVTSLPLVKVALKLSRR